MQTKKQPDPLRRLATIHRRRTQTDRQTDRQTDTQLIGSAEPSPLSANKII